MGIVLNNLVNESKETKKKPEIKDVAGISIPSGIEANSGFK